MHPKKNSLPEKVRKEPKTNQKDLASRPKRKEQQKNSQASEAEVGPQALFVLVGHQLSH